MAKANGRSGYTAGKGGQRADLRDPEVRRLVRDGKLSISSSYKRVRQTKSYTANYAKDALVKHYAQIETLLCYFNDEWFDFRRLLSDNKSKGASSRMHASSNSMPFRCPTCKIEYQIVKEWTGVTKVDRLDREVFCNIPLEKKECLDCLEQQKNVPPAEHQ